MNNILADQGATCPPYHLCLQDVLQTVGSPSHILSELIFSFVFDLILIFLIWGKLIKPYVTRKLNKLHDQIDVENGIVHCEDHMHETPHEDDLVIWDYDADGVLRPQDLHKRARAVEAEAKASPTRPRSRHD